jgi:tetratricopeptide (TPR) repeat protein
VEVAIAQSIFEGRQIKMARLFLCTQIGAQNRKFCDRRTNVAPVLSDAQTLLKEALTTSEQIADSKMQIAILNNLGLVLQLQEASPRRTEPFRSRCLRPEASPALSRACCTHKYWTISAQLRIDGGKLKQAESEFREALRIRRKLADSSGPEVAESLNSIAGLYTLRGRYDKAELLYRQALTATERSFGQNHLRVAAMLASLGGLYWEQHRFDEAESFLRRASEIRQAALPPEHPAIATHVAISWRDTA